MGFMGMLICAGTWEFHLFFEQRCKKNHGSRTPTSNSLYMTIGDEHVRLYNKGKIINMVIITMQNGLILS